mgnify:FL=1|tara:strand:+ start:426 stop:1337 length:912 start_codon:yes stop_codon:yes gene_type:complete
MVDNNMMPPDMMTSQMSAPTGNPLAKHLRQPKIYIKLPSKGQFWPNGSLVIEETGEYPVYAMTAKDEITFKTPDALLNGQATVDVIQSCIPNIKDAWQTPSIDLDAILIAIRMASFGEMLDMTVKVPNTDIEKDFQFNLQQLYDNYINTVYEDTFDIEGFRVQIKPVNYKTMTGQAVKAFEEQRVFNIVNDDSIDDDVKIKKFQESFSKLTDLNLQIVVESVIAIQPSGEEAVTNTAHIKEFILGADAKTYNQIRAHVEAQRDKYTQKPVEVKATDEEIEAGAPTTFTVPIQFDQSNFFVSGS